MKRFLSSLLVALMLCSALSLPALAESEYYKEMGFALDFSEIEASTAFYTRLNLYGILNHDPYVAMAFVTCSPLPTETFDAIYDSLDGSDPERHDRIIEALENLYAVVAAVVVTDSDTAEAAMACIGMELTEDFEVVEIGTVDQWHYFFIAYPLEKQLSWIDAYEVDEDLGFGPKPEPETLREAFERVQSGLLGQLRAAELAAPNDEKGSAVGQILRFETTDLDGNAVSSADLFRDNAITMVNCWGTWCGNCINEMPEMAGIHERLQAKGCGIVGVEWEQKPIEAVADTARQILADNGITYPNVIQPEPDPILDLVEGYPTTIFVDSEGKILTWFIEGPRVDLYESTIDALLAGEVVEAPAQPDVAANDSGAYRVIVRNTDGEPVKGVVIQLCDDATCSLQKTGDDGIATFAFDAPKVCELHMMQVPEGYVLDESVYTTPDVWSDITITLQAI